LTAEDRLADEEEEEEDFVEVVDCFMTLVDDDVVDELEAEKLELALLEDE